MEVEKSRDLQSVSQSPRWADGVISSLSLKAWDPEKSDDGSSGPKVSRFKTLEEPVFQLKSEVGEKKKNQCLSSKQAGRRNFLLLWGMSVFWNTQVFNWLDEIRCG